RAVRLALRALLLLALGRLLVRVHGYAFGGGRALELLLVALVFRQTLLSLDLGVVDGRRGGLELLLELSAALLELGAMRFDVVELALQRADRLGALPHEGKGLAIGGVKARDDVGCVQVIDAYPGEV